MSAELIAKRYAKALFILGEGKRETVQAHLDGLRAMSQLFELRDSEKILRSPIMPMGLKTDLLEYAFRGIQEGASLKNFLQVVARADRIELVPAIAKKYADLHADLIQTQHVRVTTATPLDTEMKAELKASLAEQLGKEVDLTCQTDADILGGMVIQMGNKLLDLSLKARLESICQQAVVG